MTHKCLDMKIYMNISMPYFSMIISFYYVAFFAMGGFIILILYMILKLLMIFYYSAGSMCTSFLRWASRAQCPAS